MDRDQFTHLLTQQGFQEIVTVTRAPNASLPEHAHPFEAKALILEGELCLQIGATEQRYQAGEIFHLAAQQPHSESYGAMGVTYLVGRK